jgi:ankyrin repeat protein
MIHLLLGAKAPLEALMPDGLRPLDGAILHGHLEAARMLIAAGADLRGTAKGWPALHQAAYVGHVDMVELLLRSGAAVDATYAPDGTTALFGAGVPAVATALLRAGAQPNARGTDGRTPLIGLARLAWGGWSQYDGHAWREPPPRDVAATGRVLLEAGADARAQDGQGLTALQVAVESPYPGRVALALLLLEHGADPNCRDAEGRTPLWRDLARRSGSAPLLALLEGSRTPP